MLGIAWMGLSPLWLVFALAHGLGSGWTRRSVGYLVAVGLIVEVGALDVVARTQTALLEPVGPGAPRGPGFVVAAVLAVDGLAALAVTGGLLRWRLATA